MLFQTLFLVVGGGQVSAQLLAFIVQHLFACLAIVATIDSVDLTMETIILIYLYTIHTLRSIVASKLILTEIVSLRQAFAAFAHCSVAFQAIAFVFAPRPICVRFAVYLVDRIVVHSLSLEAFIN